MQDLITFSMEITDSLVAFLGATPIIYLYGMFLMLFAVKGFKMLIS